ncbi:MAG: PhoH family protein [Proteobacteria bacterium]|nr:PhoH family protein [Pseudomonadota bacterium]NOG61540.1 PhoH family protein [Pseudomonadota bacterium]
MSKKNPSRFFVLDTNVLMHDPSSLFRFQEHDIFIPMVVLEEMDAGKKGVSEVARNVRQASRFIDEIIKSSGTNDINEGLEINPAIQSNGKADVSGRLFLQTQIMPESLPENLPGKNADNSILGITLSLQKKYPDKIITLVSKDINLRIKAHVIGIHTEDYTNDKVLDDADLLYTGINKLPENFWETKSEALTSWQEDMRSLYEIQGQPLEEECYPYQCLYTEEGAGFEALVKTSDKEKTTFVHAIDYREDKQSVWGVNAKNREQNFALNLLMDPDVDMVTLLGVAGTGKTLLSLAAGLEQVMDKKLYREIIISRVTVPVAEDIGFLPGTEEEKMAPWMGALMDNLEVLTNSDESGDWERAATNDLLSKRIKIRSLNFMRGRTFLNRYIIVDEAQNLTAKQMKTLITRSGPGSKMIILGNISQIDTPYLTETTSGLTYVVDRFKNWEHSGHITLIRGERSRLADFANKVL